MCAQFFKAFVGSRLPCVHNTRLVQETLRLPQEPLMKEATIPNRTKRVKQRVGGNRIPDCPIQIGEFGGGGDIKIPSPSEHLLTGGCSAFWERPPPAPPGRAGWKHTVV